jgi:hypothetical protein
LKRIQLFLIFGLLLSLVIYGIYSRLSEQFDYIYEHDPRYQVYNVEDPPPQIYFAGEPMPLHDKKVAKKFEQELQVQTYWNSSKISLIKRARYWLPQIEPILKQYNIPKDFKYVAVVESMLTNVESPKAAAGFWQIIASTGEHYGLEINDEVDERFHPIKATHAACKYFKESHTIFGNWTSVAASYNLGMGGLSKAYRNQNKSSYYKLNLNSETAKYVFRIVALKQLIEHPKEYGFKISRGNPYDIGMKKIKVTESISDLSAFAAEYGINLEILKEYNAWLLKNTLTIKEPGKTYTLLVPRKPELLMASEQKASIQPVAVDSTHIMAPDTSSFW